jgi:CRP/FNR family transcriptional regulator, cyclic AMP receptor protein
VSRRGDLLDGLGAIPLFAACSKRDLGIVARHIELLSVPAETVLCAEGELGDGFFVILEGRATVSRQGTAVTTLGDGCYFGELALLDPAHRDATVVAQTPMVVGVMGVRVFRAMVRDVPALTEKLLRGLARRLREADLRAC